MFSIFYFSPLWITGAAFLLNDYFVWYNMLNVFSLNEYVILLALSISIPTATFPIYFMLQGRQEKQREEERKAHLKKAFDFIHALATDKPLWEKVTVNLRKMTGIAINCEPYVVSPDKNTFAISVIYSVDQTKIGFDTITPSAKAIAEADDKSTVITECIEELYYTLYKESGVRDGIYCFLKWKEIKK